jgi:beta-lactamase class A
MRVIAAVTMTALLFLCGSSIPATAQDISAASPKPGLSTLLSAELARFSGTGGVWLKSLGTGEEASVRGDQHFNSASTIKLAVLVLAFHLSEQRKLDLNERYTINASDFRGGSGILRYNDPGLKPTLRDLLTQMVITSDNTATDIMIAKVGGKDAVNAFLREKGFQVLHLNMTTNEYFHRGDMAKRAFDETTWLGIASPAEMGRLIQGIQEGTIASRASCDEMLRVMREQQSGTRKIPHWLTVPVAHKTGEGGGVSNDVGIIYAQSGPIIVAFYTIGYTSLTADEDDQIGHAARLIVEYFDGPVTEGPSGPPP